MSHGHVTPNPDGSLARCGGPSICSVCALELGQLNNKKVSKTAYDSLLKEAMAMRESLRCVVSIKKDHTCGYCESCLRIFHFDKWLEENKP